MYKDQSGRGKLYLQKISQCSHDLLNLLSQLASGGEDQSLALQLVVVQTLENSGTEGGSLSSPRLGLLNHIQLFAEGNDALLLDCRRLLETCNRCAGVSIFEGSRGL